MAGLTGLVESLPTGVNAFDFIRKTLDEQVFIAPKGYFRAQVVFFIAIHALISLLSLAGCIVRKVKGNFWVFSVRSGLYFPNTSITTQIMFLSYSILYIVSIVTTELRRPTTTAYGVSIAAYIPLGLAIHFQAWATIYARPQSYFNLTSRTLNGAVLPTTPRLLQWAGPRTTNLAMISIAVLFTLSIIVGRIMICIPRKAMTNSLNLIDAQLKEAARTDASLVSLYSLLPTFERFLHQGKEGRQSTPS